MYINIDPQFDGIFWDHPEDLLVVSFCSWSISCWMRTSDLKKKSASPARHQFESKGCDQQQHLDTLEQMLELTCSFCGGCFRMVLVSDISWISDRSWQLLSSSRLVSAASWAGWSFHEPWGQKQLQGQFPKNILAINRSISQSCQNINISQQPKSANQIQSIRFVPLASLRNFAPSLNPVWVWQHLIGSAREALLPVQGGPFTKTGIRYHPISSNDTSNNQSINSINSVNSVKNDKNDKNDENDKKHENDENYKHDHTSNDNNEHDNDNDETTKIPAIIYNNNNLINYHPMATLKRQVMRLAACSKACAVFSTKSEAASLTACQSSPVTKSCPLRW